MKPALHWQKLDKNKVQCNLCHQRCIIADQKTGLCGVRKNQAGILYSLVYGKAIAEHIDPIEKKPLFHFLPGTNTLSIATMGCNFACQHCQNADISQVERGTKSLEHILGTDLSPEQIVEQALHAHCQSIAYTYTEPTVFFEYALDTMKLARKKNLKNIWVTNGYITKEALLEAIPYLDAANVDLKAFSEKFYQEVCGARLQPVLENLKLLKQKQVWLEVTTLLIPDQNENEDKLKKLAEFITRELGQETPWHISKFYPTYLMQDLPPTSPKSIYKAYEIGKKAGLKYIYAGNLPGDQKENTYCPRCGELNIQRLGYEIKRFNNQGRCKKCHEGLNLLLK